ncbi:MAG TPA: GrpB family protein [Ktedonobacteraceae bacterium]|nr:GrpB family protein [Ktedonobacteraceae bacterium]
MPEFMRAGDPIWIAPYDETWPQTFLQLAQPLRKTLGAVAVRIDHIGSTSVPQLAAKPVIDIQISVANFEPLDAYRVPLVNCGYIFRAENPERTKRYFRETPGQRRVHIHVRRVGSFSEQFALLFRDYLRTHPQVAADYARLKMELAERYTRAEDRPAYTEAKSPFIWSVMAQADAWAQQIGWLPGPSDV